MIECLEKQQQQQYLLQQQHHRNHQDYQQQPQQHRFDLPNQASAASLEVDNLQRHADHHFQPQNHGPASHQCIQNFPEHMSLVNIQPSQPQQLQKSQQQAGNELIGYYFGSISRDTAEWILKNHGNQQDGAYLLRSSGPNDDFVLSLMVVHGDSLQKCNANERPIVQEVLHYKIVETEDSFVALHGQVGDEKFSTIDELIEKAQGVATKPRWPIQRQSLESQILPPTYWGLTIDQVRLAILIKAKQWGFPLFSSLFQQSSASALSTMDQSSAIQMLDSTATDINSAAGSARGGNVTTLSNETIRTLIYKSLHEFQPWFHGKISREEAERRIEEGAQRDGRFLVRERDNFSYAMCISHKKTTKHYRIDVLPTGELAIQDGHKFTSLMALVSHYTIMSDGLWCALTEACPRPIQKGPISGVKLAHDSNHVQTSNNLYCVPPPAVANYPYHNRPLLTSHFQQQQNVLMADPFNHLSSSSSGQFKKTHTDPKQNNNSIVCPNQGTMSVSIKAPIKEWLQTINQKWSQFMVAKNQQSLNSFLFGPSNPLNNHCRRNYRHNHNHHHHDHHNHHHQARNTHCHRGCKICAGLTSCNHIGMNPQAKGMPTPSSHDGCAHSNKSFNHVRPKVSSAKVKMSPNNCWAITNINEQHVALRQPTGTCMRQCCSNGSELLSMSQRASISGQIPSLDPSNTLLSCLPQNSGFSLDSQSFIGSPLFATRDSLVNASHNVASQHGLGSSKSGSSSESGKNAREEKLISPAQSISANLNSSPYNMDIYGSQTSTAIVNDCVPTTSSSSSSGNRPHAQSYNSSNSYTLTKNPVQHLQSNNCSFDESNNVMPQLHHQPPQIAPPQTQLTGQIQQSPRPMAAPTTLQQAGPILCGQHAGPAYRYTNCQADDSTAKMCTHLKQTNRAIDDMHLPTPSSQLMGTAALSKFVQFQDGQCLRTHRDTRSIQMAYLLSRQQQQAQQFANNQVLNHHHSNQRDQNLAQITQANNSISNTNFKGHKYDNSKNTIAINKNQIAEKNQDFDLMDCDNDIFQFKYDPKLIKSSSIETLCGENEEEEECLENLSKFKTNSELVMSLQTYWAGSANPKYNILSPIPVTLRQEQPNSNGVYAPTNCQQESSFLPASFVRNSSNDVCNEDLYSMKKKHDLDELTTSLLAELTTSLRAQIELKNKRSGLTPITSNETSVDHNENQVQQQRQQRIDTITDPTDLINEFDTLKN